MGLEPAIHLKPEEIAALIAEVGLDHFMKELIERLERAFAQFDPDKTQIPVRDGFSYSEPATGLLEWMPILQLGDEMLMKLVGYHPSNPETNGLPTILSTFCLYDGTHGGLKAILDGTLITALRTGAASAVASRFLAKPESSQIGVIGCGAQSITQVHALAQVFEIDQIRYYDLDRGTLQTFEQRCRSSFNCDAEFVSSSPMQCVSEVDILCVATSVEVGFGPVFEDMPVREHLHINAVGSDFPGKVEVPLELLQRSYVSPDCLAQAVKEGECQLLGRQQIGKPITELLQGGGDYGLKENLTVFDSTGWALEDLIVTKQVLEKARDLRIGSTINIADVTEDPKNPYESLSQSPDNTRLRLSV